MEDINKPLAGTWAEGKKDPSLPDSPTVNQLQQAGYKEEKVYVPFYTPPPDEHGSRE